MFGCRSISMTFISSWICLNRLGDDVSSWNRISLTAISPPVSRLTAWYTVPNVPPPMKRPCCHRICTPLDASSCRPRSSMRVSSSTCPISRRSRMTSSRAASHASNATSRCSDRCFASFSLSRAKSRCVPWAARFARFSSCSFTALLRAPRMSKCEINRAMQLDTLPRSWKNSCSLSRKMFSPIVLVIAFSSASTAHLKVRRSVSTQSSQINEIQSTDNCTSAVDMSECNRTLWM